MDGAHNKNKIRELIWGVSLYSGLVLFSNLQQWHATYTVLRRGRARGGGRAGEACHEVWCFMGRFDSPRGNWRLQYNKMLYTRTHFLSDKRIVGSKWSQVRPKLKTKAMLGPDTSLMLLM